MLLASDSFAAVENFPIGYFDSLGTGIFGELPVSGGPGGFNGQQLYFRGVIGYNGFAFGWGFSFKQAFPFTAPAKPVISFTGSGLPNTSWGYEVVAVFGAQQSPPSAPGYSTDSNSTLSSLNYNTITWSPVPNATGYKIYRVATSVSPTTLGLIATVGSAAVSVDDKALPGDGTFPSAAPIGTGEGPARVMFPNINNPLKWGNDNINPPTDTNPETDRAFTDSDAIVFGGSGEHVRAACVCYGALFFGTNSGLHYVVGYGRDSFSTNGATPIVGAFNCIGPGAMIEGPDRRLYGIGDDGLWRVDQGLAPTYRAVSLFDKLWTYDNDSPGYWDLLWANPTATEILVPVVSTVEVTTVYNLHTFPTGTTPFVVTTGGAIRGLLVGGGAGGTSAGPGAAEVPRTLS